jgi:uncharacterized protein with von Willebrand factor type A (vWA) domain
MRSFQKFITFGAVADPINRKKIADFVYDSLFNGESNINLKNSESSNYASSLSQIISNEKMKNLSRNDSELSQKITEDVLDFINRTKKAFNKLDNPYEEEQLMLNSFKTISEKTFRSEWDKASSFVKTTYGNKELDTVFYEKEFVKSLNPEIKDKKQAVQFESVKEHFIEKWEELLIKKQTKRELEFIDREREKFCEELYKKIEELMKIQELLEPFTNELGRLWDMSKGSWNKNSFDIIKKYAELMKKDKTIQELAEMLGRMRSAEKEYEEELFTNIKIMPEWKFVHAEKSDLVGIRESDDLSSLLPSETVLLADKATETVFFKKFVEKKLQTFEYIAKQLSYREEEFQDKRLKEKEEPKGPFIICVDTSGSMHGTPENVAKTLCFALLKIALRDNRKCYLISFSTSIETLDLADLKNSIDKIIDFLSMSFHGGTDAAPAMKEALRMLSTESYKKADVIVVSDFIMSGFDKNSKNQIEKAKENGTKFHSLLIGRSQNPQIVKEFDNNWQYNLNESESVLTLVKKISSL